MCVYAQSLSHVQLFAATRLLCPWDFSRQGYWSGLPLPTPGNLPNPVIEPASLASPDLEGGFFTTSATWEAQSLFNGHALIYLTLEYTVLESKNYCVKPIGPGERSIAPGIPGPSPRGGADARPGAKARLPLAV